MSSGRLRWPLLGASLLVTTVFIVGAFDPSPHAGGDNSGYLSLAFALVSTGAYTELFDPAGLPHTKYPPLFPAILALLMGLGARTWVAFKSVAAVSSLAVVAFTFLWAERRLGLQSAFLVAILIGVSPGLVYYSHWILSDPVFFALTMAALWALDRPEEEGRAATGWWVLGTTAAGLAYFTRSAGLPLVVALLGGLALRRRWTSLATTSVALGVPMLLWWLRGRGAGATYAAEFWMVDPYDPGLGTIGVLELLPRVLSNLATYVLAWGPFGIVGTGGAWAGALGVTLTTTTLYGWVVAARDRLGPAELFLPSYAALILVWPEVWAGDRFALPLYPLVLVYTALALRDLAGRVPPLPVRLGVAAGVVAILVAAGASWVDEARWARTCSALVRGGGTFACAGPRVGSFVDAARWAGAALPSDAAVMTRKPRHFYVLSGVPSRTFPFVEHPRGHLSAADAVGARYVLLDTWDGLAGRYVGGAVIASPGSFCFVNAFGEATSSRAQLLGIVEPSRRGEAAAVPRGEVRLARCPPEYAPGGTSAYSSVSSLTVPLLDGLDP